MCIDPAYFAVFPDFAMRMCKVASSVTFFVGIATVSAIALVAAPADALTLEANGQSYNVTVIEPEETFDNLLARDDFAELMPWFDDQALAEALAVEAGNAFINDEPGNLGLVKFPDDVDPFSDPFFGPLFAFNINNVGSIQSTTYVGNGDPFTGLAILNSQIFDNSNAPQPYVVIDLDVEAIPTPALIPGLLGMGLAAIRKHNLAESDEA